MYVYSSSLFVRNYTVKIFRTEKNMQRKHKLILFYYGDIFSRINKYRLLHYAQRDIKSFSRQEKKKKKKKKTIFLAMFNFWVRNFKRAFMYKFTPWFILLPCCVTIFRCRDARAYILFRWLMWSNQDRKGAELNISCYHKHFIIW